MSGRLTVTPGFHQGASGFMLMKIILVFVGQPNGSPM
jgi:hypothetical protein